MWEEQLVDPPIDYMRSKIENFNKKIFEILNLLGFYRVPQKGTL